MGMAPGHLGHVTWTIYINVRSPFQRRLEHLYKSSRSHDQDGPAPCPYMVRTLKNLLLQNQKSYDLQRRLEGRSGAVDRASDFGPRGPWFDSPPVHISLWP